MAGENEKDGSEERTEEETAAELYSAVDAAIDDATPASVKAEREEDDDTGDGDTGDDDTGDGESDDSGDEGGDGEGDKDGDGEGADDDAGEKDGDGEGKKPDGQSDDKSGEKDGDGDGKKPDHINDPIPTDLAQSTQDRIRYLVDENKKHEQTAQRAQSERDEILHTITETRATPEQYAGALGLLKLYNSDSADDKKKALEAIQGMERDLRIELGQGGDDLVQQHDDLMADVETGKLTQERAQEIALSRAQKKRNEERENHTRQQRSQEEQTQQLVATGKQQLNEFQQSVQNEPEFKALYTPFVNLLKQQVRRAHPSDWGTIAKETYEALKANYTPAPETKPRTPPKNEPLRHGKGGSGGGGSKTEKPSSALGALDTALEGM